MRMLAGVCILVAVGRKTTSLGSLWLRSLTSGKNGSLVLPRDLRSLQKNLEVLQPAQDGVLEPGHFGQPHETLFPLVVETLGEEELAEQ